MPSDFIWSIATLLREEQRSILAVERDRTAELESALRYSLKLLHERRRALITAAVTGQIKV